MQAKPGDRILIHGQKVGERDRKGIILEVHGRDGGPPYLVEWASQPGEHLFFPGSDAIIKRSRNR
ncbi:MAG: DUF1918 domain-containing protein [Acidimicrobiia bacterium]|nr:DUF1918 domain-containing protein [Acidimicrobiia bacterium]MDH5238391.1 DUF1918 domain-containing protein [Acidimicrobiia bacterium]